MIEHTHGDLLKAEVEALVNTVNTVGVMGRGIAFQFKRAFPANFKAYKAACKAGEVLPGKMFIQETGLAHDPRLIVNFPTKRHWRSKSRLEDVREGLADLASEIQARSIRSIALPPLGCGLGGLQWPVVRRLIEEALEPLPDVRVLLFEPQGAPSAAAMSDRTKRPALNQVTAILLGLIERYRAAKYEDDASLLEVHKLLYFQQQAGEPLELVYEPGPYGPYAKNLRHVLKRIEGHYVSGYGDATDTPGCPISPVTEHLRSAEDLLAQHPDSRKRMHKVEALIEGFETPYGLELLTTVHWVAAASEAPTSLSTEEVTGLVHAWSNRKADIFPHEAVAAAYGHLRKHTWLFS